MNHMIVKLKKLHPSAILPSKKYDSDVGLDLYAIPEESELQNYDVIHKVISPDKTELQKCVYIPANSVLKIKTGIAFAEELYTKSVYSDETWYAKVEGRSGLASQGIIPVGGIIDPSYRGDISVLLCNITSKCKHVNIEKAIAQLVIYYVCSSVKVEEVSEVKQTERGDSGFGSTDKKN